jgi:two-component system, LytTR family, response regulator
MSVKLNCIVVDDSSIQRILVTKLVESNPHLILIDEFSNAIETKNCLATKHIDLLFLDIEMPVISGFNLLDGLKDKPQTIFITSKSEYAVKAFDYDATDYLQKPITKERFNAAVKRALDMYSLKKDLIEEEGEHIFIKSNLKKLKIYTARIKWIEAFGDYIKIITEDDAHLVLSTMKAFEKDLPKERFIRVHKSYIVNVDKVEKYNSKFAEIGTTKIPLSRIKKEALVKALTY